MKIKRMFPRWGVLRRFAALLPGLCVRKCKMLWIASLWLCFSLNGFAQFSHVLTFKTSIGVNTRGITSGSDGTLFIAFDHTGLGAYTYDGSSLTNTANINPGIRIQRAVEGPTGAIFAATYSGLHAYTYNGSSFTAAGNINNGGFGEGIAVHSDGTIFLANGNDGLRAYTYNGSSFTNTAHINDGGYALNVAVSSDGTIFLANNDDGLRAYTYNGSTFTNTAHIDDGGFATSVAVSSDGTIFLANHTDGLRAYTYDGSSFSNAGHFDNGSSVLDLVVRADGTIFLANHNDDLNAFSYNGSSFTQTAHALLGGEGLRVGAGLDGTIFIGHALPVTVSAFRHHLPENTPSPPLAAIDALSSGVLTVTFSDGESGIASVEIKNISNATFEIPSGSGNTFTTGQTFYTAATSSLSATLTDGGSNNGKVKAIISDDAGNRKVWTYDFF